jgi:co-chaperonin GroES (HSP10)
MYVNVNDLVAANDNVVLKMVKWPSAFTSSVLVQSDTSNTYDNGRELYLGEVKSSGSKAFTSGEFVAIDIYFGSHVPSEVRTEKIKIVPASGIILKGKEKLNVMSDILKMDPGIDRIIVKLKKKESVTAAGIHIPDVVLSQDPTAQDVRMGEVIKSNSEGVMTGDLVIIEAFVGKSFYLDADKSLFLVCYGNDILAKIDVNK